MKLKSLLAITLLVLLIFLSACHRPAPAPDNKLTVAVSIVPQATFVEEVAGDLVEVITMIPPGGSPETYSPTPRQLEAFTRASAYFSIGVPSEVSNILPRAKDLNRDLEIIDLAKDVSESYPDIEIAPGERDPHIWLSPKRVKVMVERIADELSDLDPANKDVYNENALKYKERLDDVDKRIAESLDGLETKTFIAYHPAFGYFAHDYGLRMLALEEEGKEATPQTFKDIIDIAKEMKIEVIFYQAEVDSRQSEAFAKEIGGRTEQIAPLAPDYIENLERMADTFSKVLR